MTKATPFAVGFSYMPENFKMHWILDTTGNNGLETAWAFRHGSMILFGNKIWANAADPMNNVSWAAGLTGHLA